MSMAIGSAAMTATRPFGPVGEFAASRHGVLSRSQAARLGYSPKVLRRFVAQGMLDEPVPGVYVVRGAPPTWRQRLLVATLGSNAATVAAGRASAALHRLDSFEPGPIELLAADHRRPPFSEAIVRCGPFHEDDLCEVDGIHCTTVERTLCDLAGVVSERRLRLAFDSAWRRGMSLDRLEAVATRLASPHRRGPGVVLALIGQARDAGSPTESPLEVELDGLIGDLPGLVRQLEIVRDDGSFVARPDFAFPDCKVAIEAHSRRFHFGLEATEDDADRELRLIEEGWIVRYITRRQMRRPHLVRASIERLVAARRAA